ncbi:MAG: DNA polymerase III subunit gamma/tau [Deltaproteobacteria bacterium]|nr:DNA polymerase III subunit gamma/tau [Deltaproteobacteria bacterium]
MPPADLRGDRRSRACDQDARVGDQDRAHRARLSFTGTRGIGKTTVARVLAKALNCEKGPTPAPCNKCVRCQEITRGNSVDVFEIDGASNNSVDDVRELRENVKYLPQASRHKIVIIDEVHQLSGSAFNALLKTLEEPPPHVVFIFATTEAHKIPDTILSRVQQYDFKMISLAEILESLKAIVKKEKLKIADDHLLLIARKAEGSMRDALSYLDQVLSFGGGDLSTREVVDVLGVLDRRLLIELSDHILAGKPEETLALLERLSSVAWDVKPFYGELLDHFRNLVVAKISKNPGNLINATEDELAELTRQAQGASYETLENLFSILVESEEEVLRSSYPRPVLEMTLLRLASVRPVRPLDELAEEIGKLRQALGGEVALRRGRRKAAVRRRPRRGAAERKTAPARPRTAGAAPEPADEAGRFIHSVRDRDFAVATMLGEAQIERAEGRLTIRLPKGLHYQTANKSKELLDELAVQTFGPGTSLVLEEKENGVAANGQNGQRAAAQNFAEKRKTALGHPTVRLLQEQFPDAELSFRAENGNDKTT